MRIGIDGGAWLNRRGYGRYTRSLLGALARRDDGDRYLLFADPETARRPDLPPGLETIRVRTRQPPARAAAAQSRRDVRDLWRMGRAVARERPDVFFFPSVHTFFPLPRAVPGIVAIHDVIAERYPRLVFPRRRFALYWKVKLAVAVRQAHLVVTVSEHARAGIVERFGLPPDRVRVVLEAPDPIFRPLPAPRDPSDLLTGLSAARGAPYILYVGGFSPHKQVGLLIEAFRRLSASPEHGGLRLLLVGDHEGDVFHSAHPELRAAVARHHLENRVHFTGFVPDEALVDLYNRAELLALPSLEEGFGLPAVEAAACGTPVVAGAAGPVGDLLGPGAVTVPPGDAEALGEAIDALLRDPARRREMGVEGQRRAAALSWDRAAAEMHAIFREVRRA